MLHGFTAGLPRGADPDQAQAAIQWLERETGRRVASVLLMTQPHGRAIVDVAVFSADAQDTQTLVAPEVDGAEAAGPITPLLVVKSADCVPILAVDPELNRCAGVHAGWRGVAAGILPHLLQRWRGRGSSLRQVRLAFGPHIRQCCFEVRQDCVDQFQSAHLTDAIAARGESRYLSLETVLRAQAARAGVRAAQIDVLPQCTDCYRAEDGQPAFASYRRSNREGRQAGRNLSFIAIFPDRPLPDGAHPDGSGRP
jgi:hypothetical protein